MTSGIGAARNHYDGKTPRDGGRHELGTTPALAALVLRHSPRLTSGAGFFVWCLDAALLDP
jgi:hypothetical protein